MIGQTLAIFVDAYRELNARKLFWLTVALSLLIVAAFATIGVDDHSIGVFGLRHNFPEPLLLYNNIFQFLVIGVWLTWAATIIALVSTAGIFPDFVAGGSVDLFLARPISRARLFLTKYFTGLVFVAVQVVIIALGSYLALGLRAHEWKPRLFLTVPIVLCFFSYLYSVSVLIGVKTRSTIAALLLTVLFWVFCAAIDMSEPAILSTRNYFEYQHEEQLRDAEYSQANFQRATTQPILAPMAPVFARNAETSRQEAKTSQQWATWVGNAHRIMYWIKTITPKTTDTINLLNSSIFDPTKEREFRKQREFERRTPVLDPNRARFARMADEKAKDEIDTRSTAWIIGTSLAFEAVIVSLAMWTFCRRDY